jgi:hypothetical protein
LSSVIDSAGKSLRALVLLGFLIALSFVSLLATSSRGALFALLLACPFLLLKRFKSLSLSARFNVLVASGVLAFFMLGALSLNFEGVLEYINDHLELDSDQRGVGSGLTGRSDNWPIILTRFFNDPVGVFLGNGYRSWDVTVEGIETDSSYINLLWEFGVVFFCTFVLLLLYKGASAWWRNSNFVNDTICALIVFVIAEAVVARYMLAIGNPASLMLLSAYVASFSALRR